MPSAALEPPISREAPAPPHATGRLRQDSEHYLAPWIHDLSRLSAVNTTHIVGVIEVAAGIAVAVKPRYCAYIVAAWLAGIIVNLLSYSGYYDVALRDFGLMLAALTLARLATTFDPPGLNIRRGH